MFFFPEMDELLCVSSEASTSNRLTQNTNENTRMESFYKFNISIYRDIYQQLDFIETWVRPFWHTVQIIHVSTEVAKFKQRPPRPSRPPNICPSSTRKVTPPPRPNPAQTSHRHKTQKRKVKVYRSTKQGTNKLKTITPLFFFFFFFVFKRTTTKSIERN